MDLKEKKPRECFLRMTPEEAAKQLDEKHEKIVRMREQIRVLETQNLELKKSVKTLHARFVSVRGWS